MKLVVNIKLTPTEDQAKYLRDTLETANAACNYLSDRAFKSSTFGQYALHKLAYHDTRAKFPLVAQMVVRSIAKVADAYKTSRKSQCQFRPHSAQPYDHHIIRFTENDSVSLWTTAGRQKILFVMGEYQRRLFPFRKGEVDLMLVRGKFYLSCVCDIDEPELIKVRDVLGVDLGIVNIATDSNGRVYSGKKINRNRCKFAHRRRNLQRKQTKPAKRKLKEISGKQSRFQRDTNHCISKTIVTDAQRTSSAIALEDLSGIRKRVTARRHQRARLSNWGFYQLRSFTEYKAKRVGIPLFLVDPKYTSQICPSCGHTAKANRKTRDEFSCVRCGHAGPADAIAALNIRARALVNVPNGSLRRSKVASSRVLEHGSSVTSSRP